MNFGQYSSQGVYGTATTSSSSLSTPQNSPRQSKKSLWDYKIETLFDDLSKMPDQVSLDAPSPQLPAVAPSAWVDLISAAVRIVDVLGQPETKRCVVCLEDLSLAYFPNRKISSGCNHEAACCLSCLRRSIKSDHENKIWGAISCPECSILLSHEDVRAFADHETCEHYNILRSRIALSASPDFVWCLACPSGRIHEGGHDSPTVICQECHASSCFTHQIPWHDNFTCSQYDKLIARSKKFITRREREVPSDSVSVTISEENIHEQHPSNWTTRLFRLFQFQPLASSSSRSQNSLPSSSFSKSNSDLDVSASRIHAVASTRHLREAAAREKKAREAIFKRQCQEEASLRKIKRLCKLCPGPGCDWPIEKVDGCAHMVCIKCRGQFCWKCRSVWKYGHKCWRW